MICLVTPAHGNEENLLILDWTQLCGDGGTLQQSRCWEAEGAKADRWLQNIVQSYHALIDELPDRVQKDGFDLYEGYDPVGNLDRSQAQFEAYRKTMDAFYYDVGYPGSMRQITAPIVYYKLTVDRARELLLSCGWFEDELPKEVDLTNMTWCPYTK